MSKCWHQCIVVGPASIRINDIVQNVWQDQKPSKKSVTIRDHTYRIGDKVLQLVNNPERNVFNGDLGIIVGMEAPKGQKSPNKITIDFDETEVTYENNEWTQFTLAYCTSIHKAQGSEFKMVILPIVWQFSRMLQRNLLYTAVTRASDFLIMLGEKKLLNSASKAYRLTDKPVWSNDSSIRLALLGTNLLTLVIQTMIWSKQMIRLQPAHKRPAFRII